MERQDEPIAPKQDRSPYSGALSANAEAVRKVAEAVQGTLGPKGLDTMLVNDAGEVIVTNDGVTILNRMEIHHPAARMVAGIARAQQEEVGDGTTTATLLAAALVEEGVKQVNRGVPVAKVIAGIRRGVHFALEKMQDMAQPIWDLEDEWLQRIAYTAGREQEDITELVMEASILVGREKLLNKDFRLSEAVVAHPRAESGVFAGLLVPRGRVNLRTPELDAGVRILVLADDFRPEPVDEEALGTEAGFAKQEKMREAFEQTVLKLIDLDVGLVMVEGEADPAAEEWLSDAGIVIAQQVARSDLDRVADHTGARVLKRNGLKRSPEDLKPLCGFAEEMEDNGRLGRIRVTGGQGKPFATILVSASTEQVIEERERITKDAAAAVQAAVRGGFLPGGGAAELALAREVEKYGDTIQGMEAFGVTAVAEALQRPMAQVVANAGFNPLEKVEEVKALQWKRTTAALGLDCDRGVVCDVVDMGVVDPLPVKYHALQAAGEVSTAILRIHTVVKMRDEVRP
ncbi:chaperonin GroEL (HSP60 family) [Melghirimyces profundicolus]|uniref:Chaperonin GroEL (HSP60 family) n=1 Tax=Melghirimyces profundicolus TaxID=1242148 RepID=A0A2T6C964_9BACL|nr:TCP-1/cpn60 chaperonin family protein [Melghirimyces profundicolus]PTX64844.1 chaperonin GroEL (HSP60 family) [Melghirimyces profundicolus]